MQLGLEGWHRAMRDGCPAELMGTLIADDAVFHSPVVHTPQQGREKVVLYLTAASQTFANSEFAYVRELVHGLDACLEFTAKIDGIVINGIDLIRFDTQGRIVDFKVMVRPLKAVNMLWQKMAEQLQK